MLKSLAESLEAISPAFLNNPAYKDFLAVVKGARNGAVYGAKIRYRDAMQRILTSLFSTRGLVWLYSDHFI